MKYTNDFAELAKVFEAVAKVEVKAAKVKATESIYRDASDKAFEHYKIGSDEVHAMLGAYDAKEKALRAYRAAARKCIAVMELSKEYYDDNAAIRANRTSDVDGFVQSIKWLALKMAKRTSVYPID